jgi:antitoxin (DNA-binding transcriptional repressor) of toxin-antitoxin stability system
MIIVNTHEAKTKLSQLLALIEQNHETIRVCRHGKPIADIVPIPSMTTNPLQMHPEVSNIKINYDPTAPLEDDEWPPEDD